MPRFYVKNNEGLWNIYSTIIDDYYFLDFMDIDLIKCFALGETIFSRLDELESLESDKPKLNVLTYGEAESMRRRSKGEGENEKV